ncbi:phosphate transport regulator [Enterococcus sp. JM4C]|uniref:DUF47 domain-containing protein n=1 Tax=Candidatus Enterococcus huntleyi TaxID=1857217 RepID=UPI00137A0D73|nr:DUF47 family protein [Enterococcus sp. JM4C]KAF1296902.1 phosphate transport regulator [Enterococcus sp. JM4C]
MARKKQYDYFVALEHIAANTHKASTYLLQLVENYTEAHAIEQAEKIHMLEKEGDQLVRDVMNELYDAFITPIDREDIVEVTDKLDDILDGINGLCYLFGNLAITEMRPETDKFVHLVVDATEGVLTATKEFAKFKNSKTLKKMIQEVNDVEAKADHLYSELLRTLFTTETNPIEIIKWKNVYDQLELTMNRSELVVDLIDGLVIKNT